MKLRLVIAAIAVTGLVAAGGTAGFAQTDPGYQDPMVAPQDPGMAPAAPAPADPTFSSNELVSAGHQFFGDVSQGLAGIVEHAVEQYGLPNGYILGQEGSGAIIGGARYGEGELYTRNAGQHHVYWQGPSIGLDVGANGDKSGIRSISRVNSATPQTIHGQTW